MFGTFTKGEITGNLERSTQAFVDFCSSIPDDIFFRQPSGKWSIAQNVKHLVTSAQMTRLAYRLPKIMVRLYAGKPNRASRSYDELVQKYKTKLEQGGKASGRFDTKPVPASEGKGTLLSAFQHSMHQLIGSIEQNWTDSQLDQYIAPHPLLGKITLREMGYFTIHHVEHHLAIIKDRLND